MNSYINEITPNYGPLGNADIIGSPKKFTVIIRTGNVSETLMSGEKVRINRRQAPRVYEVTKAKVLTIETQPPNKRKGSRFYVTLKLHIFVEDPIQIISGDPDSTIENKANNIIKKHSLRHEPDEWETVEEKIVADVERILARVGGVRVEVAALHVEQDEKDRQYYEQIADIDRQEGVEIRDKERQHNLEDYDQTRNTQREIRDDTLRREHDRKQAQEDFYSSAEQEELRKLQDNRNRRIERTGEQEELEWEIQRTERLIEHYVRYLPPGQHNLLLQLGSGEISPEQAREIAEKTQDKQLGQILGLVENGILEPHEVDEIVKRTVVSPPAIDAPRRRGELTSGETRRPRRPRDEYDDYDDAPRRPRRPRDKYDDYDDEPRRPRPPSPPRDDYYDDYDDTPPAHVAPTVMRDPVDIEPEPDTPPPPKYKPRTSPPPRSSRQSKSLMLDDEFDDDDDIDSQTSMYISGE